MQVKAVMVDNIDKVMARGAKLDDLSDKTRKAGCCGFHLLPHADTRGGAHHAVVATADTNNVQMTCLCMLTASARRPRRCHAPCGGSCTGCVPVWLFVPCHELLVSHWLFLYPAHADPPHRGLYRPRHHCHHCHPAHQVELLQGKSGRWRRAPQHSPA